MAQNALTLFTGHIKYIYLSAPNNFAYRISLDTNLTNCTYNFAYVNVADGNYDAYASLMTTAAASGKSVNIWVTTDANGFCHLDEAQVLF